MLRGCNPRTLNTTLAQEKEYTFKFKTFSHEATELVHPIIPQIIRLHYMERKRMEVVAIALFPPHCVRHFAREVFQTL